jgi:hypothetical protein
MTITDLDVSITSRGSQFSITDLVEDIVITESLFGDLTGKLEITDGLGMLDMGIDDNTLLSISFRYRSTKVAQVFYVDGVNNVDVSTSSVYKKYSIKLRSTNEVNNSTELLSRSFEGLSTDIVKSIHEDFFNNSLVVLDKSITKGKYISPNISPKTAISTILSRAYNKDISPFFIFQRLASPSTFLTSLSHIEKQSYQYTIGDRVTRSGEIQPNKLIGVPSHMIIHSSDDNLIQKISSGMYGRSVKSVDLSSSSHSTATTGAFANANSAISVKRLDLYGSENEPLFKDDDTNLCSMQSTMNALFNTSITAYGCEAIPSVGVGNKIKVDVSQNKYNKSGYSSRYSGAYLVSRITHKITDLDYTQNIDLIRG